MDTIESAASPTFEFPPLTRLGYVGVSSDRLGDWASFACDFAGMQQVDSSSRSVAFRMDDQRQRLMVRDDGGHGFFGWETDGSEGLDEVARRLDAAAVAYEPLTAAEAAERSVAAGIRFTDPEGNRVEVFHGPEAATDLFVPGRNISGFRAGTLGMGHAVLLSPNPEPTIRFYRDVLGFRLSDFTHAPFSAHFFHLNPRHHSLAVVQSTTSGVHHLMVELQNLDDVGQGYDIIQQRPDGVGVTLGRHSNDHVTSFYARTPSGFMLEYGWGGLTLDPRTWQPFELQEGPSLWGHDRSWLPPEGRQQALALRMQAAADGLRSPVHVHGDNYDLSDAADRWDALRSPVPSPR